MGGDWLAVLGFLQLLGGVAFWVLGGFRQRWADDTLQRCRAERDGCAAERAKCREERAKVAVLAAEAEAGLAVLEALGCQPDERPRAAEWA